MFLLICQCVYVLSHLPGRSLFVPPRPFTSKSTISCPQRQTQVLLGLGVNKSSWPYVDVDTERAVVRLYRRIEVIRGVTGRAAVVLVIDRY